MSEPTSIKDCFKRYKKMCREDTKCITAPAEVLDSALEILEWIRVNRWEVIESCEENKINPEEITDLLWDLIGMVYKAYLFQRHNDKEAK